MENSRSSLCEQDISELFGMLESSDVQIVEGVKAVFHENLNGTKDVWLLHGLLDYYIAIQSVRALDILVRVREPHDKNLFDRMVEYLRKENTRYNCLLLLSHIIQRQPTWLFKITQHRVFQAVLNLLKNEVDPPCLMCSLFSVASLLPVIPYQISSYLNDIFEIFSRLASWSTKKNIGVPEVYVLHLQVGVYALFHRLYGMYPCNFLGYLRSHYGGREYKEENIRIFTSTIRPMLERVKLHPLLVTACKDSETSQRRWKRMAIHDIVALCASVSLDVVEGTSEDGDKYSTFTSIFSGTPFIQSQDNSMQYLSYSSTISMNMDSNLEINDNSDSKQDYNIWTPSFECGFSTPPPTSADYSLEQNSESETGGLSCSGIDNFINENDTSMLTDLDNIDGSLEIHNDEKIHLSVGIAFEAREEELDKEISELTSDPACFNDSAPTRLDTPFRCTTQNLTDKADAKTSDEIAKNEECDDICILTNFSHQQPNSNIENFVRTMNRLRYFSQCGLPPEISAEPYKIRITRSLSCPNIKMNECSSSSMCLVDIPKESVSTEEIKCSSRERNLSNSLTENATWSGSACMQSMQTVETSYDHLIPMALHPLIFSDTEGKKIDNSTAYSHTERTPVQYSLSPAELLDRHLQLGTEANFLQLNSIPLTFTRNADWTHFGGRPPPDEIAMSQIQIQLLHNQVMFERHRREIHAERNRRLLGKAKRSRIQDECTTALKDQLFSLEKEMELLQLDLKHQANLYQQLENNKKFSEDECILIFSKSSQEKSSLQYSNKKLQGLLVSQKEENDCLKNDLQQSRSEIIDLQFELELLGAEIDRSKKLDKENLWLAKENVLLQEINRQYKHKLERIEKYKTAIIDISVIEDSSSSEISDLREILESNDTLIDSLNGRNAILEEELLHLKDKVNEQSFVMEQLKAVHKDEIMAREDRLSALQKLNHHHLAHILELHHCQEKLKAELEKFGSQAIKSSDICHSIEPFVASESYNSFCIQESNTDINALQIFDRVSYFNDMSNVDTTNDTDNLEDF